MNAHFPPPADGDAAIVVTDLAKNYGEVQAVRGISFAVQRGAITALLGGNGAGKTTTLSMLLMPRSPQSARKTPHPGSPL